MNLLIIGGTVFLGRHLVEAAQARGHTVTLFNRGQHNPDLFPDVEKLRGDRDGGMDALKGRTWDAVIDTCGYVPRIVRQSVELLADSVGHYTFISSISVFAGFARDGMDESAPIDIAPPTMAEEVTFASYGPLKAACEAVCEEVMPGRTLVLRPGLIVGPYDSSDRFTYWPYRVAQGGPVLAPGEPGEPAQIIDVRDLAEWNVRMVETGTTGIYNATGPDYPLTIGTVLETCKEAAQSDANFVWLPEDFLEKEQVGAWMEMPLWIPRSGGMTGLQTIDCGKALRAGLTFRPLLDTCRDTLAWAQTRPATHEWKAGMKPEREAELLARWKTQ